MESNTCISPLATRPILYTDTLDGVQTCRDDLWAVTTEELNAAARAAPGVPAANRDLAEVHAFLLGEGQLKGFNFGDTDTERPRPRYWWRDNLRMAISAAAAPSAPAGISQQAGGAVPVDRDSFEAWAKREGHENFMRMAGDPDQYDDLILRANFKGWMAANPALAVPVQADRGALLKAITDIKEMTDADDPESYRCDDREGCLDAVFTTASQALAATPVAPPASPSEVRLTADQVEWVVNDNAELGVKIGNQFFFLYKGASLVYEAGKHDDGAQMMWRQVGKGEFGEVCVPVKFHKHGMTRPFRYTDHLTYTPGFSFGNPGDADWRALPGSTPDAAQGGA